MSLIPATDAKRDAALVAAIDQAREAVVLEAGSELVGEHLAVVMEGERLATHTFACLSPAYVGWQWAVTLARAPRAKTVTVTEVVLLPGEGALVAPEWVPWSDRVRPGDLGPGDVLPTSNDDPRLVAGLTGHADLDGVASRAPVQPSQWEIGLGRIRVLSPIGRDDAADRWVEGDFGPGSAMAKQATLDCGTCGFMLPMDGPMGQQFAVCANEMSPADGHVVALTFGCGAHSEAFVAPQDEPEAGEVLSAEQAGADELSEVTESEDSADVADIVVESDAVAGADADAEADDVADVVADLEPSDSDVEPDQA